MKIVLLSILYLFCTVNYAQSFRFNSNPVLVATGNIESLSRGVASLEGNPAGLSDSTSIYFSASPIGFKSGINAYGVGLATHKGEFNLGIKGHGFGNEIYKEGNIGFQASHKISNSSLGIRSTYNQISITDVITSGFFSFDIGIISQVGKNIVLGALAKNIIHPRISENFTNRLPIFLESGIGIIIEKVFLAMSVSKYLSQKEQFHLGFEYRLIHQVKLRGGITSSNWDTHLGLSILVKKNLFIDNSFSTNSIYGFLQKWGIGFYF